MLCAGGVVFLLKKRLPGGRLCISSFRENFPNLVGTLESGEVGVALGVASGGAWSLMNARPYFSF